MEKHAVADRMMTIKTALPIVTYYKRSLSSRRDYKCTHGGGVSMHTSTTVENAVCSDCSYGCAYSERNGSAASVVADNDREKEKMYYYVARVRLIPRAIIVLRTHLEAIDVLIS